jgi:5-oxoprolinase (ATP-hydrolysing)
LPLALTIDRRDGSATLDFEGTGTEIWGNCNAPKAVTKSAILYCLRCLIKKDLPLNYGCLIPITIIVPKGSLLDPSPEAAVVGGNVLTSQRITDVVLKAFGVAAASQGCMNNFTFGNDRFGYYETVGGGAGAGDGWHGQTGVHTHMTNTRITDPEILERRYPVLLRQFAVRRGSGGQGKFNGGDGLVRELEFLEQLNMGILSERRVFAPYGLEGGGGGYPGGLFRFPWDDNHFATPPRWAASIFSFRPPMGSTRPRRVISPVMATSRRTGRRVSADTSEVHMVIPADGPSLGMAPSGIWMCRSSLR